jgi:hypothetical protein
MIRRTHPKFRPGAVAMILVIAMVLLGTAVVCVAVAGTRQGSLSPVRNDDASVREALAAGVSLALREIELDEDTDGDGGVGAISHDGNDANNPAIAGASFLVERDGDEITCTASRGSVTRSVTLTIIDPLDDGGDPPPGPAIGPTKEKKEKVKKKKKPKENDDPDDHDQGKGNDDDDDDDDDKKGKGKGNDDDDDKKGKGKGDDRN